MKNKGLQKLVLSKYECGSSTMKIFHYLCGPISRKTIFNWCKMVRETGPINMTTLPGYLRIIRTKNMIQKINSRLKSKKRVSSRKLAQELDISRTSVRRVLRNDLGLRLYKKRIVPLITETEKSRKKNLKIGLEQISKKKTH